MSLRPKVAPDARRVVLTWDRARRGSVISSGPEVSKVRFDDGSVRFVGNLHLADCDRKDTPSPIPQKSK